MFDRMSRTLRRRTVSAVAVAALAFGGSIVATSPSQAASAPSSCPYKYLCLYSGQNYTGNVKTLYTCESVGLEKYAYPGGGDWRDKTRSIYNHQTSGTKSDFYDTQNGSRMWVGSLTTYDTVGVGFSTLSSTADKKIDFVRVC
ncbi:peptidase inhibitor family I36 protein [Streptomyces sp. NPDC087437]|uniref:peptidase inhibitor family I36 protein n=1 Tax=Streptomyces sp. NPDC087437 TaxID=3365789 RepID=UPI00381F9B86